MDIYQALTEDARLKNNGSRNVFRSYKIHKFFNNRLIEAGCDLETKEILMAHRTRESRGYYNTQVQNPEGLRTCDEIT